MLQQIKAARSWVKDVKKFVSFLKRNKLSIEEPATKQKGSEVDNYIVLIEPWKATSVCWYGITLAILLKRRGKKVTLLFNDIRFEKKWEYLIQLWGILFSIKFMRNVLNVHRLSEHRIKPSLSISPELKKELYDLAFANAVHANKGEAFTKRFKDEVNGYYDNYLLNFSTIEDYIKNQPRSKYIIPGGIYSFSGIFLFFAQKYKHRFCTYDSGFGVMLTSHNGVAAQVKDIPQTLELILKENNLNELNKAKALAFDELEKRIAGKNIFKTQYQTVEESISIENVGILIPLNSAWDSATLKIDYLFGSYSNWIVETVGIILAHSKENITIRQHPDERHWYGKSNLDIHELLKSKYGNNERVQFISCYDQVNSYVLLDKAELVICYSSTIGIEAALRGRKVIVCSNVYYSEFDFVNKPADSSEFASYISNPKSLRGMPDINLDNAIFTYYLGQKCNWLFTDFTPTPSDFYNWTQLQLEEIEQKEDVQILLKSIETSTPLSYLAHKKMTVTGSILIENQL